MNRITKDTRLIDIQRKWFIADANDKVLGRLASKVARVLIGKGKPEFTPHLDCGDYVIIINASRIKTTGKKLVQKLYFRHSGWPKGDKLIKLDQMLRQHPETVIQLAVKGMLPQNRLGRKMLKKMKIYKGDTHPHKAQKLEVLSI